MCLNCNKKGHTKSKCTARAVEPQRRAPAPTQKPMSVILRNKYAAFLEEEEEEEKREEEHKAQYPALGNFVATENNHTDKPSYSSILKTTKQPVSSPAPAQVEQSTSTELTDYMKRIMSFKKKNWADYSDSESEDGYFEN